VNTGSRKIVSSPIAEWLKDATRSLVSVTEMY